MKQKIRDWAYGPQSAIRAIAVVLAGSFSTWVLCAFLVDWARVRAVQGQEPWGGTITLLCIFAFSSAVSLVGIGWLTFATAERRIAELGEESAASDLTIPAGSEAEHIGGNSYGVRSPHRMAGDKT